MNQFIISFRECLEASLIVGIIYTFLQKTNMKSQITYLWRGVFSAIIASIAVAFLIINISQQIENESIAKLCEAIFMFITAGLLIYVVFWLSKSISDTKKLENLASEAAESSKWGIFLLVFFAILREGFETVMFLISSSIQSEFSYLGFILGIAIAIFIGYMIFIQGKKINLKPFFAITTFFLVLFAAGMAGYGSHEMEEFLVKGKHIDSNIKRPWNILEPKESLENNEIQFLYNYNASKKKYIHILHDKGTIGVFLKGFFGYNSNPNWIELFIWASTLIFGLNIWRQFYF